MDDITKALLAALRLVEADKDGDGFVCRDAMPQVREAIALAERNTTPSILPDLLQREAQAIGASLDGEAIEQGEPA